MEVFQTEKFYIFVRKESSLWWNRSTSEFTQKAGWDLSAVDDIECLGLTPAIVGTCALADVLTPHLVIVRDAQPIGCLYPPDMVYKINSVCILSDDQPDGGPLQPCPRHSRATAHSSGSASSTSPAHSSATTTTTTTTAVSAPQTKSIWGAVKSAGNSIKNTTAQAAALASSQVMRTTSSASGQRDPAQRIERRITDELHKMFDDTDSFYFCPDGDITHNLQRRGGRGGGTDVSGDGGAEGEKYDERFFWNQHMLAGVMALNDPELWLMPVIQGFVQIENCIVHDESFTLALCSRRSRHRAGTRYKRRGVDEAGHVANYVETEQILTFRQHQMAFTQVRGSVPVYWSQPGFKYRPPPRLDRDASESQLAFGRHFATELATYGSVFIVNLVEQAGKERVIFDAYGDQVVRLNDERLTYVTFDFHDYCRGMRFENVAALIEAVAPEASAMGFAWSDAKGLICKQRSVFRVNCMDCLDRTNVVQTAFGKTVLESQLVKLGLAPPYSPIPEQLKVPFMMLWANNGDIISRQYAGTNALKGDYTRTGERKFTGLMKDGMNSANRYYLARFKDAYRQATIDLQLGNEVTPESLSALGGPTAAASVTAVDGDSDATEGAEHARLLVEDCRRMLLGAAQFPIGAWGLIDADPATGDQNETEVDSILLLTDELYLMAEYDSHLDKIVRFEKVPLQHVTSIEFGLSSSGASKMFQSTVANYPCIRLNYAMDDVDGYFHMFRSPNIRFFNNMALVIRTQDEVVESLTAIVECFRIALLAKGRDQVPIQSNLGVLQRRKSRTPMLDVPGIPRNHSESQLMQMGSKALSNVTGQFSKFGQTFSNPLKSRSAGPNKQSPSSSAAPKTSSPQHQKNPARGSHAAQITYSPSTSSLEIACVADEDVCVRFQLGDGVDTSPAKSSPVSNNSGGAVDSSHNALHEENAFLPSVGIVMSPGTNVEHQQLQQQQHQQHQKQQQQQHQLVDQQQPSSQAKRSADVCTMSISSVTENVTMPVAMLDCGTPVRAPSPAPEIRVTAGDALSSQFRHSSVEVSGDGGADDIGNVDGLAQPFGASSSSLKSQSMHNDLSLNLNASQSETAMRQLRTLTSPLSKLATGMKSIGMNLDPRKMNLKSPIGSVGSSSAADGEMPPSRSELTNQRLHEQWETSKCKTKLIAL